MKIQFKDIRNVTLQNFIKDAKNHVVTVNNNDCEELIITKGENIPFMILMKYGKLRTLIENTVRAQIREIDSVVARSVRKVNMQQLTKAQINLLKIRSRLECFESMSEEDVMNVTTNVEFLQYNKKEMVFDQGHSGEKIYYIVKGSVKIFAYNQDEEDSQFKLLASLGEGAVMGEMSPITGEPRSARALTAQDSTILLSFEFQKDMAEENKHAMFQLYKNFVNLVSRKLIDANNKLTSKRG